MCICSSSFLFLVSVFTPLNFLFFSRQKPPLNIPDGCKLILDGCNHLLVSASDYNVECLTGKRVSNGGQTDSVATPVSKLNTLLERMIGLIGSNQQTSLFGRKPQKQADRKSLMGMRSTGMKSPMSMMPPGMMGMMPPGMMGMPGPAMFGRKSHFNPSKFLNPEYEPTAMDFYHLISSTSGGSSQTAPTASPYDMAAMGGGFPGAPSMGGGMPGSNPGMVTEFLEAAGMSAGGGLIDSLIMNELFSGMDAGTTKKPEVVTPKVTKSEPSTIPPPVIKKVDNTNSLNALTIGSKSTNTIIKEKPKYPFPLFTGKDLAEMMLLKELLTAKRTEKSKNTRKMNNIFANNKATDVSGTSTGISSTTKTDNIATGIATEPKPKEAQPTTTVEQTTVITTASNTLPSVPLQDEAPVRLNSAPTSLVPTENIATSVIPENTGTIAASTVKETPISSVVVPTSETLSLLNTVLANADLIKTTQLLDASSLNISPSEATKIVEATSTNVATDVKPTVVDYTVTNSAGTVKVAPKETTQAPTTIGTTDFGPVSNAEAALLDLAFGDVSSGSTGLLDIAVSTDPVPSANSQWANLIHVIPQGTTDNSLFAVTTTQPSILI